MITFYDTTLRDGAQSEDIAFSVNDKLRITEKLDAFGMDFIEGGWPGSNPKDLEYFDEVRKCRLDHARIVAFSSTVRPNDLASPERDAIMQALIRAETTHVTIVGKAWDLHVRDALRVSLDTNLRMIDRTIRFLKEHERTVFFDAEHFFDGFKGNRAYALKVVGAAFDAGADVVVLCDTNGGGMPFEIGELVAEVRKAHPFVGLGIHCHNDTETAVANTLMAVRAGCTHVQGTTNGYGERCGNANLCSIIPDLILKMGCEAAPAAGLSGLRDLSLFVDEVANLIPDKHRPYVGDAAFAHKGGIHVSAVRKNPMTYEHINPALVGNSRRVLVSDLSGEGTVLHKAAEFGIDMEKDRKAAKEVLKRIKELEHGGYKFEGAEASLELLMKRAIGAHRRYFDLIGFRVVAEKQVGSLAPSEATIMLKVDDRIEHTAAFGNGPVNALDGALRKALHKFYPVLRDVTLVDYKVRALSTGEGTGTVIRVLIESSDGVRTWETVGVSENIIEASWQALVDSIDYKLLLEEQKP
ncbi:MAG: citramalate synthase [Syntrophorhabdales bacterium]